MPRQQDDDPRDPSQVPDSSASLTPLSEEDADVLREVAAQSIRHGLEKGRPLEVIPSRFPPSLQEPVATFVTLNEEGRLRGCVGSLQARRPLVEDVAHNAFAAAFRDSRFPPVSPSEFSGLEIHLSLLTPPEPLPVEDEEDLLRKLRPGEDGLVLEDPPHRATFLPQVWESLPEPQSFVRELKRKAGLPPDHWSSLLRFFRYSVKAI